MAQETRLGGDEGAPGHGGDDPAASSGRYRAMKRLPMMLSCTHASPGASFRRRQGRRASRLVPVPQGDRRSTTRAMDVVAAHAPAAAGGPKNSMCSISPPSSPRTPAAASAVRTRSAASPSGPEAGRLDPARGGTEEEPVAAPGNVPGHRADTRHRDGDVLHQAATDDVLHRRLVGPGQVHHDVADRRFEPMPAQRQPAEVMQRYCRAEVAWPHMPRNPHC